MVYKIKYLNNNKSQYQQGNTLIEAMVSLVILSFGLLGIAGLLLASTGQQKNSQSYSVASILINDITERMRANKDDLALNTDNYITPNISNYEQAVAFTKNNGSNNNSNGDDDDDDGGSGSSSTNCNTLGANCSAPGALASSDLNTWLGRINTELPGGAGVITQLANDDVTSRRVVITWNDKATSTAENASTSIDTVNCPANFLSAATPTTVRCITVSFRP